MHPLFSDARHLIWYLVAWLFIGNAVAATLAANGSAPHTNAIFFCLPVCLMFGFVAMSAYYVCRSQPMARRRLPRLATLYCLTSLISGLILLLITRAWAGIGEAIGTSWSTLPVARSEERRVGKECVP